MIVLDQLRKQYPLGDVEVSVLEDITLNINRGEYVALVGSSGSGKTTLMNLLGFLDTPSSGQYEFDGVDVGRLSRNQLAQLRGQQIGFVFQNFNLLPRSSALENVLMPTRYGGSEKSWSAEVARAKELLTSVGLGDRMHHTPNQLSGGERQRVAIARALINRPSLLLADEPTGNLDSKTEAEILEVFRKLNREQGITLVVVTHDAAVSEQADRIIRLRDGRICDDTAKSKVERPCAKGGPDDGELCQQGTTKRPLPRAYHSWLRTYVGTLTGAVRSMRRNLLRTTLTMIGIIIGVGAVVSVMEMSLGASNEIERVVSSMGVDRLSIEPGSGSQISGRSSAPIRLNPDDAAAIASQCSAIKSAAPIILSRMTLIHGNKNWRPRRAIGSTSDFLETRNWTDLTFGKAFDEHAVRSVSTVCVIGQTVAQQLFDDEYPIGQEIRINDVTVRVIGVLSPLGADVLGNDQDDIVLVPWTTLKFRINGSSLSAEATSPANPIRMVSRRRVTPRDESVDRIYARVASRDEIPTAKKQIRTVVGQLHRVAGDEDDLQIHDMTEVSHILDHVLRLLSTLGLVIAAVSLVVGGVGIMNIMLVSVTERTREIGLRIAVGARASEILRQFLVEATTLCLIGGATGIAAGHGASMGVGLVLGWPTQLSVEAAVVATTVSAILGIVFGYYPARRASRLNPIDALRYE